MGFLPLFPLLYNLFAADQTAFVSAKKYGGGGSWGGGGSGVVKKPVGGSVANTASSTASRPMGPIQSYGAGYADKSKFSPGSNSYGGRYSKYPNGGYSPFLYSTLFLHSNNRRRYQNSDDKNTESDEYYFDRIENGCQLIGIESYRTIDNNNNELESFRLSNGVDNTTTDIDDWVGCTEEWKYVVAVTFDDSNRTFVSPPVELYACDRNDMCSQCSDELRGPDFDALALEDEDFSSDDLSSLPYVDCHIPKNLTLVNETYYCRNEECIFLSEKYAHLSSGAAAAPAPSFTAVGTLAVGTGIAMALCGLFL